MNSKERNEMITNIVNYNRVVLISKGKAKNRACLEKYRNQLDLKLKNQLDQESIDIKNELINFSDEDLKRINNDNEVRKILSENESYDYDPDYYLDEEPDDLFN